jgi:hypothetical protein
MVTEVASIREYRERFPITWGDRRSIIRNHGIGRGGENHYWS